MAFVVDTEPATRRADPIRSGLEGRLVVVSFRLGTDDVAELSEALATLSAEAAALNARVAIVIDGPADPVAVAALVGQLPGPSEMEVEVVPAAAKAPPGGALMQMFDRARASGADLVLLDAGARLAPGALTEMAAAAQRDPMTAVVEARANLGRFCRSPALGMSGALSMIAAVAAHARVAPFLPEVSYIPNAEGGCRYIRNLMLVEFGGLDPIYGGRASAVLDFVLRCNRKGYRAVVANRAFVFRGDGERSGPTSCELVDGEILLDRFPEYAVAAARYLDGVEFKSERLLAGMAPDAAGRPRLLFDCRNMGPFHNGTFEHTRALIGAFAAAFGDVFAIHLTARPGIAAFHGFDRMEGLAVLEPGQEVEQAPFAVAFRVSQPFAVQHLLDLGALAPLFGFLFLDTIAMDCQALDVDDNAHVWSWMAQTASLIGFNSLFTARQFKRRFALAPGVVDFVSLCSTEIADYASGSTRSEPAPTEILVVGNAMPHKALAETAALVSAVADRPVTVLGAASGAVAGHARSFVAGELDQAFVDDLYARAAVVVFPTHYEGFGLPVMHALARRRPVVARDLPPFREIRAQVAGAANLHLYETTAELAAAAAAPISWIDEAAPARASHSWADAAEALREAIAGALARFDYDDLRRRVLRLETCRAAL